MLKRLSIVGLEVPVEAAFRDAQLLGALVHAQGRDAVLGQLGDGAIDPGLARKAYRALARYGIPIARHSRFSGFDDLIAHAAYSRDLVAGTIIGSGTVSNTSYREIGSSCIAERRGIEMVDLGEPKTGFMRFGDRVRMEARLPDGSSVFGAIDQMVVKP